MKLITTIHLAIGFVLLMFSIVTFGYIRQTRQIRTSVEEVLYTSDIIREGESAQKLLLDMETGLRGYLLTGREVFLAPYYNSNSQFWTTIHHMDSLTENTPPQNRQVHLIKEDVQNWLKSFAEPLRLARSKAEMGPVFNARYDSLFNVTAQQGKGKVIIDKARLRFENIEKEEEILKQDRVKEMRASIANTNYIAIGLTLIAIIGGTITAFLLGKTISKRFIRMTALANSIANGNYGASLTDSRHDEISSLTMSLNKMAAKLQENFNHLTKMNRELDQFAYVVSHDLKAPLRAINNLAEWIAEDLQSQDPDILNNLSILRGRVHRMENLINGILEYSKVGRKELPKTKFEVQEVVKETIENLSPPPGMDIRVTSDLPIITGERTLFYQVLSNLVSNAIKYHHLPKGTIEIRATQIPGFFRFEVQDDGPGIPKEYHEKVFGIFQTMTARDVKESTGVGLAIVKKIVEEKGGQIWIESEKGIGTTFLFTWPLETDTISIHPETESA
ncbi:MAG: sensor histidine kinase [Rufibacter sp.]